MTPFPGRGGPLRLRLVALALLAAAAAGPALGAATASAASGGTPAVAATTAATGTTAMDPATAAAADPVAAAPEGATASRPEVSLDGYVRLLEEAARGEALPPPLVVVNTSGGSTVVDHRPLLPGGSQTADPETWRRLARAAAALNSAETPAPRGSPEDLTRLQAVLAARRGPQLLLDRLGRWIAERLLPGILRDPTLKVPRWVSAVLTWGVTLLAVAAVLALGVVMIRQLPLLRSGDAGGRPGAQVQVRRAPQDAAGHLAAARAAAARGETGPALAYLYQAVLMQLAAGGHLRLQPWCTGRAYLRELERRHPELAHPFAQLTAFCEVRWYGGQTPAPADFSAALELAGPLLGQGVKG